VIGSRFPGYEVIPAEARAGLIVVHGIAEHGERYRHVAAALAVSGIACFIYDQRGHGNYPGPRTHVADFDEFAQDLRAIGDDLAARYPKLPIFIWGHSMGSIVATLAALGGLGFARGIITTGCALDAMPKLDGFAGVALKLASSVAPRIPINLRIDASVLMQDPEEQRRHMTDPLVSRSASLRLLYGFAAACRTCRAQAGTITLPWLAVHGEADKVCPISGSRTLIERLGSRDKQLVSYPGLLHEVHNEDADSRAALFTLMSRWILERTQGYTAISAL
jgi:alpha-beta hydrolase superfamily lysophospholipase